MLKYLFLIKNFAETLHLLLSTPVVLYDKVPHDQLLVPLKITLYLNPKKAKMQHFVHDETSQHHD